MRLHPDPRPAAEPSERGVGQTVDAFDRRMSQRAAADANESVYRDFACAGGCGRVGRGFTPAGQPPTGVERYCPGCRDDTGGGS